MTIQEIKQRTHETSPYFFTKDTLRFFRQTMRSFKVYKWSKDGVDGYKISAPMKDYSGEIVGYTERFFNPITNELESVLY